MSSRPPHIAKTGLGRGLDQLMTGTKTAGQTGADPDSPAPAIKVDVQVSPGLGTLLRGSKTSDESARPAQIQDQTDFQSAPYRPTVIWSLVGADLLLLGQATLLAFKGARPPGFAEFFFSFLCVALGAWLACLAVLLHSQNRR